ncbi:MAG: cytochrome c biogenesis protein CcsA [Candidatus Thorarchaeota archaeon]
MDIGTIFLTTAIGAGLTDLLVLLAGPRIKNYETISIVLALIGFLSSIAAMTWMGILIFGNDFSYEYVYLTTNLSASWPLKLSALWAGQSGSLVFWTMLSFILYFGFRTLVRGYEDDRLVYRAAVFMIVQTLFIALNAVASNPFRPVPVSTPTDGLGLNPLLSTIWNVIHPPIVFIAYALAVVPFSIKLAGFTMRSDERNEDPVPVVESVSRLTTVASWLMLSIGIAIGGYWAYIVLGWGGYWAWDPVETTSLVPWLLLTAYYHARAVFRNNDVLRDSFVVFAYVTVLYATWVTRSGVLNSVHGFQITAVSWTMFATVLVNFAFAAFLTARAGYIDLSDDEDGGTRFFSTANLRNLSIKVALIGILIVTATSVIGVVAPAAINLTQAIIDPINFQDNMVGIGIEFFRAGFYAGSLLLIVSAFYCMKTALISNRRKGMVILVLLAIGAVLGAVTVLDGTLALPTLYWPANALIPLAVGGMIYLIITFVRSLAGREGRTLTMRRMGRLMLHLGIVVLLLGVFASENVVHETNAGYLLGDINEIAPGISVQVTGVNLVHWNHERDFLMVVTVHIVEGGVMQGSVLEGGVLVGIGVATVQGNPEWNAVTHDVYIQSTAFRDVFIAVTGFRDAGGGALQVTLHTKVLPFVSFVWLGAFLMVMALMPMAFMDGAGLRRALQGKEEDLYEEVDESPSQKEATPMANGE